MAFDISDTTRFERDFEKLARRHREVLEYARYARQILSTDPYNVSRQYKLKKLTDIPAGDGQWRLTVGRYRIRYDIRGKTVELHSFKPRPE
ncbi:MAG: hypothetical protein HYS57_02150, partial [Parcubacteria group bacterium]|nr:hypothetical protein [Parcubacteria group bacterium]